MHDIGIKNLHVTNCTWKTHVVLPPVEFLRRLAALIPPPRFHTVRYFGLFAPHCKQRPDACALVPKSAAIDDDCGDQACGHKDQRAPSDDDDATADAPHKRRTRMLWSQLLRRVFATDVLSCPCGGQRRIIGVLSRAQNPEALHNVLFAIGEPTEPPPRAPARAPPQTELPWSAPTSAASPDQDLSPFPNYDDFSS